MNSVANLFLGPIWLLGHNFAKFGWKSLTRVLLTSETQWRGGVLGYLLDVEKGSKAQELDSAREQGILTSQL